MFDCKLKRKQTQMKKCKQKNQNIYEIRKGVNINNDKQ